MTRIAPRIAPLAAALVLASAAAPAIAQQLRAPEPPVIRATPRERPAPARIDAPRTTQPPVVASDPRQRPQDSAPIPETGPATKLPTQAPRRDPDPAASERPLRDASGRPVGGMVRVAPNRVYDPASGRYYWTTPGGQLIGSGRK